uniref:Transposase Tc1-like domain-containing protein n=1 Tax=Electrophorus electricus TaxID=8005 RepID=A0AAY5EA92_ELEEL
MSNKTQNLPVSTATIRRCLREAKPFARNPRKVPLLKKRDVLKCRNILWTDESKIYLLLVKNTDHKNIC